VTTQSTNAQNASTPGAAPIATLIEPAPEVRDLIKQAVEAARVEEKQKLHKDLEDAKARAKRAEDAEKAREAAAAAEAAKKLSSEDAVQAELRALREQNEAAQRAQQAAIELINKQQRDFQMSLHRERRLREAEVPAIVAHLVTGDTPEALEVAINVAKAEYATFEQHFAAKNPPAQPAPAAEPPATAAPAAVVPVVTTTVPVVTPPTAAEVGITPTSAQPGVPASSTLDIAFLTSPESMRNGTYAKHREAIHQHLRNGSALPSGTTIPMRPMSPQAIGGEQMPAQPQMAPQATMPQPAVQHVVQPGGIQQPTGLPTPQPVVPGAVQTMPGTRTPTPDQQAAAAAAHAALQNPALTVARASGMVTGGMPATHPEYAVPGGTKAPEPGAFLAPHPMMRG